jgi:hypothetical protein
VISNGRKLRAYIASSAWLKYKLCGPKSSTMARILRILFGSFGERLSVPVYCDTWWFFHASMVEPEGGERTWNDLADLLPECPDWLRPAIPERVDLEWFQSVAPTGLQSTRLTGENGVFPIGFVACQVRDGRATGGQIEDIAFPFLLAIRQERLSLEFSERGPDADTRHQIAVEFGIRLLRGTPEPDDE